MQTFSKWVWVAQYHLNETFIAAVLCENKEKVELKCKGKCQLAKNLAADEKGSSENSGQTVKHNLPEALFISSLKTFDFTFNSNIKTVHHPALQVLLQSPALASIFHPPAVA